MTVGKAAALTAGFLGAFALGIAIGPSLTHWTTTKEMKPPATPAQTVAEKTQAPAATPVRRSVPRAKQAVNGPKAAESIVASAVVVPLSEPRLHEKMKPLLNRGARMEVAADGFKNAEEFAAVAHAARNTNVPFMVLKHGVISERLSLADAIHQANPSVDANEEAQRALRAAKSDIAAVAG